MKHTLKTLLTTLLAVVLVAALPLVFAACNDTAETSGTVSGTSAASGTASAGTEKVIVHTNAFFAPFEYFDGTEIKGVDVDVMALVGEKLNAEIEFVNVEFSAIVDNVAAGKVCDCGAAGITVTDERKEKVDFSIPYYTSVQYVIYATDNAPEITDDSYILWDALAGKKLGVQTDTTGMIYADGEINATESDPDYGYNGVLYNTNTELVCYDNAQLAADAIGAYQIDYVIVDELPAQFITEKNSGLSCLPLYYKGEDGEADSPTEEQYAICVTKGNTALLEAINEVLTDLMQVGEDGETQIDKMIMEHMGLA